MQHLHIVGNFMVRRMLLGHRKYLLSDDAAALKCLGAAVAKTSLAMCHWAVRASWLHNGERIGGRQFSLSKVLQSQILLLQFRHGCASIATRQMNDDDAQ